RASCTAARARLRTPTRRAGSRASSTCPRSPCEDPQMRLLPALVIFCPTGAAAAHAHRVKDLASVAGVRTNQLVGYGLVVGLDGSGDQTSQAPFTIQSIRNMLAKFGVTIPANVNPQLKNVAAVVVHAELPPFTKAG